VRQTISKPDYANLKANTMARIQQRLNRLEAVTPEDKEQSTATEFLGILESWTPEHTLFESDDESTPEQVRDQCLRVVEQVRAGEVDFTLSAIVERTPPAVFHTLEVIAKRVYGDDF
jgi:hypothetical protein